VSELTFEQGPLRGTIRVAGDKSISHRALMLAAVAEGESRLDGLNLGADVTATRDALTALGGRPLRNASTAIDARNSGTTVRLLAGLCAGAGITATFDGDESLRRRPMERVARPLRARGAEVVTTDGRLPMTVRGIGAPPGGTFELELPSAQVKSAILLANLGARGPVVVTGDRFSRDHTERMLRTFGRTIAFDGNTVILEPGPTRAAHIEVPADLSAAAFFIVAAAITPGSDLRLIDVGVNPTRIGFIDAMRGMGAEMRLENQRNYGDEPVADIVVRYRPLHGTTVEGDLVVRAIDEIPILAVAAAHAYGTTRIRGAAELRSKESDRLTAIAQTLRACNLGVIEHSDGLDITGGSARVPAKTLQTWSDHRIAMSVAALAAPAGQHRIDDAECIDVSFPGFAQLWRSAQGT